MPIKIRDDNASHGFSLLEILVALAIAACISFFSYKLFFDFSEKNLAMRLGYGLMNALQLAQSTAQNKHLPIILCPSNQSNICSGNWVNGWIMFINEEKDGLIHKPQSLINVTSYATRGFIYWRSFPNYRDYLLFVPHAFVSDNSTFWYCAKDAKRPLWAIVMNYAGHIRMLKPNKQGIILDSNNKILTCADKKIICHS